MGKNLSSFMNPEFLEQYRIQAKKRYDRHKNLFLDKYGINIDLLNSYFPEFYNYIENRQFREAYRCLKAGEANFSTEEQKQIYDTFEKICFNREEMDTVKPGDWVKDDYNFIYNVLKAENGSFLIKKFFDARTIRSIDYQTDTVSYTERFELMENFKVELSNLDFFQKPTAEETAKIELKPLSLCFCLISSIFPLSADATSEIFVSVLYT